MTSTPKFTNIQLQRIRREIERMRLEASDSAKAEIDDNHLLTWVHKFYGNSHDTPLCQFLKAHPHNCRAVADYILRNSDKIRLTQINPIHGADSTH